MARTTRRGAHTRELFPLPPERTCKLFARVAIQRPVRTQFTYSVPDALVEGLAVGMRVVVSFGRVRELGVVVALERESELDPAQLRPIQRVLDTEALISPALIELTRWIAEEYACSWGEALAAAMPAPLKRERQNAKVTLVEIVAGLDRSILEELAQTSEKQHRLLRTLFDVGGALPLRDLCRQLNLSDAPAKTLAKRGWVKLSRIDAARDPLEFARSDRPRPQRLLPAQVRAIEAITGPLERGQGASFLLQGVTGSGKTEVYLAVIERALALGRGAIVLVPEIALTPQTVGWFRARFERVAVLHSRMTDGQRLDMWLAVRRGEARVVVGARSAVFAPVADLGVVVVDEEHEPSFKQSSTPRYHAREVALRRAAIEGAVCVLGSATPSLETWNDAHAGRHQRIELKERASGAALPPVEVLDLRTEPLVATPSRLFTRRLVGLIAETVQRGEQVILFQNRRGFAPTAWCSGCKETVRCRRCDSALAFHARIRRMVCHLCCEEHAPPKACPTCTKPGLRFLGAGAERVESEVGVLVPRARVRRMDSDTMRRREDYEETLAAFGRGEIDVLVGTQMIAKGLDFPRVTLVGIVDADGALHLPDFRAAERTFQLIAQVAGRAGRGKLAGRIVVQTFSPEHPSIQFARTHDYEGFARAESALRGELGYPPHGRLVRALFEDPSADKVVRNARALADELRRRTQGLEVSVLGPAPAPIEIVRGRHRHHLLVKSGAADAFLRVREELITLVEGMPAPRPVIDVDPASVL